MSRATLRIIITGILCALSLTGNAAGKVCGFLLSQSGCKATLTFETDRYGDVVITMENGANTSGATFRGNGMGDKLNSFWVKVQGQPNDSACHYFTRIHTTGSNVFRLSLTEGKTLPAGAEIYFDGIAAIEWKCDQNGNLWLSNQTLTHSYGTTCATLQTPMLNSIDANYVLDFTKVNGADYYTVAFYLGRDCAYSGTLAADGSTAFRPFLTDTYEIVVQAWTNAGLYSNESNPLYQPLQGDTKHLPASEICEQVIQMDQNITTIALLNAETTDKGVVQLTLVAGDGGTEADTRWRNSGLPAAGFKYNGKDAADYFTFSFSSDYKTMLLTPKTSATVERGRLITYNEKGENVTSEWRTSQHTNAYSSAVHFTYRYGTQCLQLATPVITAIMDSVPIFEAVAGADEYIAQIYLQGQLRYRKTIQKGETIHFVPDQTATYQLTLIARGEGMKQSGESAPFDWVLKKKEVEVGPSEYCNVKSGSTADPFQISFETLVNGDVEITISGEGRPAFRANGMGADLASFRVGSLSAAAFFDVLYTSGSSTYTLQIKDTTYRPSKGEMITFNGTVEYTTVNNADAYGTYSYTYTYGSVCDHLETPVITGLQSDGSWTLDHPIEGAEAYRVLVYRDGFLMQDSLMQLGELLTFSPWHNFVYLVKVQAVTSQQVMNSAISNPYEWRVKASGEELPMSSVCHLLATAETTCGKIYVTAITDEQGRIIFSIENETSSIHFRANGLSKLLYMTNPITSYFERTIVEPDSTTMILTPLKTAAGVIYSGDPISSMGSLEWISDCNTNGYVSFPFTYLYGTDCSPRLTRLATPSITEITPLGDITFDSVDNAQSYRMRILDGDEGIISEAVVSSGDRIDRYMVVLPDFDYYVLLQAWPQVGSTTYRESLWSDPPYPWKPSALPTGMQNAQCTMHNAQCMRDGKYIINGQLVIIYNGSRYNAQGHRL